MNTSLRRFVLWSTVVTALAWPGGLLPERTADGTGFTNPTIAQGSRDLHAVTEARIIANDNRKAAGVLRNGTLSVRIEARTGEWHPDRDNDPGLIVHAFGERDKPLQVPGTLFASVPVPRYVYRFTTR